MSNQIKYFLSVYVRLISSIFHIHDSVLNSMEHFIKKGREYRENSENIGNVVSEFLVAL